MSALPTDGIDVIEVSWTGRVAPLRGPYAAGLSLSTLDLETTVVRQIVLHAETIDHYTLTSVGTGVWLYDLPWNEPPTADRTASLIHLDLTTLASTSVLEETVAIDPETGYYERWVNNSGGLVELPSAGATEHC